MCIVIVCDWVHPLGILRVEGLKHLTHCILVDTLTVIVGSGRVVRWCCVNFQCRGVLLIWIIVGQGPTALAAGAGGGCLDSFSLVYHFSLLSPSLWETPQFRLKYCLKGPLSPKQPTNQLTVIYWTIPFVILDVPGLFCCCIVVLRPK